MKVDKIYVIALDHSDEKFTDIKNRLSELNIPGIPYLITNAFDGRVNPTPNGINLYEGWNLLGHSNDWWNREILPGEIGCSVSHINVWRDIVNNGHQRVLVLEEDFKTIKPLYELSDEDLETLDWDFCYLGRNKISKDATEESITEKIVNPSASYNYHAYLLTL
jgi:collagen beta-1,O-galactosyltransferase